MARETFPRSASCWPYFELHPEAVTNMSAQTRHELGLMAKASSNEMAAESIPRTGAQADPASAQLASFLRHKPRRRHLGGQTLRRRQQNACTDPIGDFNHAATVRQLLRYFLSLEQGRLVSPAASHAMREIFASPDIPHDDIKFVKALSDRNVQIIRKWGSWEDWLHDSAVVTGGGRHYILAALTHHPKGR